MKRAELTTQPQKVIQSRDGWLSAVRPVSDPLPPVSTKGDCCVSLQSPRTNTDGWRYIHDLGFQEATSEDSLGHVAKFCL